MSFVQYDLAMVHMLAKDVFKISHPSKQPESFAVSETVHFCPRLAQQRLSYIISILARSRTLAVLEIGIGPGTLLMEVLNQRRLFLSLSTNIPSLNNFFGVDIDGELVEETRKRLQEHAVHASARTKELPNICIQIYNASLAVYNPLFRMADTIVATEVIEHLDDDELHSFSTLIFGAYHPSLVVLTTPNFDFNKYFDSPATDDERRTTRFNDPTGRTERIFRQADHRFEWTMDEFQAWCDHKATLYGHTVEYSGVGAFWSYPSRQDYVNNPNPNLRPPTNPDQFFASQIAIFRVGDEICTAEHRFVL